MKEVSSTQTLNEKDSIDVLRELSQYPVPQKGAVGHVYERLKRAIVDGDLTPGSRLVEDAVAQHLGVSRTPVREAINRLELERLVQRAARKGVIVTDFTPQQIEDLYTTRAVLEGLAARLAAQIMLPRDHVKLEIIQSRIAVATQENAFAALASDNFQFHQEILRATNSESLTMFMSQIHDMLKRYRVTTMGYPGRAVAALQEHEALLHAIKQRQPEKAEKVAREHINNALAIRLLIHAERELKQTEDQAVL